MHDLFGSLKFKKQWVCWSLEPDEKRPGKMKKVPKNPRTGRNASSTDPTTWGTRAEAIAGQKRFGFTGIGVILTENLIGVDIDHCLEGGKASDLAVEIITEADSYTEISPSGTGIHILAFGTLPPTGRKNDEMGVEMYGGGGRYFTVTGRIYGTPRPIQERTAEFARIHEQYLRRDRASAAKESACAPKAMPPSDSGANVIDMDPATGKKYLKNKLLEYLMMTGRELAPGRNGVCPVCDGGHRTGCASLYRDNTAFRCFSSCGRSYDIFDLIGHDHHVTSFPEKLRIAEQLFGIRIVGNEKGAGRNGR